MEANRKIRKRPRVWGTQQKRGRKVEGNAMTMSVMMMMIKGVINKRKGSGRINQQNAQLIP
jgi:hypothetical protein